MNNFDEVASDIINLLTDLHYEDKDKELIKFQIVYVLYKMLENEEIFNNDLKALDENARRGR